MQTLLRELRALSENVVSGRNSTMPGRSLGPNWSDTMSEVSRDIRFAFRQMFKWPETYLVMICFVVVMSVIVGMAVRMNTVNHLQYQIQESNSQNVQALKDITYLTQELKDSRATIKQLRERMKSDWHQNRENRDRVKSQ